MATSVIHRALFSFACLFLALSALAERGGAAVTVPFPYLVGSWSGEFTSSVTGTSGSLSLDIATQDTRRFQGTWTFAPPTPNVPPSPCMVHGGPPALGKRTHSQEEASGSEQSAADDGSGHGFSFWFYVGQPFQADGNGESNVAVGKTANMLTRGSGAELLARRPCRAFQSATPSG